MCEKIGKKDTKARGERLYIECQALGKHIGDVKDYQVRQ